MVAVQILLTYLILFAALTIGTSTLLLPFYPIYAAGHRSLTRAGMVLAALSFLAGIVTSMMGAWG
ncbi:MAG: hypothetical protein KC777_06670 [Cyanobacteria bacterium HKST-UBA02]|nr:hypothetical protein [Cyanobacteria bacterium HKST-UBA02]